MYSSNTNSHLIAFERWNWSTFPVIFELANKTIAAANICECDGITVDFHAVNCSCELYNNS